MGLGIGGELFITLPPGGRTWCCSLQSPRVETQQGYEVERPLCCSPYFLFQRERAWKLQALSRFMPGAVSKVNVPATLVAENMYFKLIFNFLRNQLRLI